ncbi:MAG: NAD-binding protein [Deltaproteobacteria bacterium]|nr:NAD-binding protein [Deltaproteobacteria bacterium]
MRLKGIRDGQAPSARPGLDPLALVAVLQSRPLGSLLCDGRVRCELPGAPPDAWRALADEINLRLEINRARSPEVELPWALASVLASLWFEYRDPKMQEAVLEVRRRCAPALPALMAAIGGDPIAAIAVEPARSAAGPAGALDLSNDLWIDGQTAFGRGALIRAALEHRREHEPPMPLLGALRLRFGSPDLLRATSIFAVQHVLSSTVGLFRELELMSLDPPFSFVLGKRSSTDGLSRLLLEERYNFANLPLSHGLPGAPSWHPSSRMSADEMLDGLLGMYADRVRYSDFGSSQHPARAPAGSIIFGPRWKEPIETAVFLDDGAEAICRAARDPRFAPDQFPARPRGVEQTRLGARRIRALIAALEELPFGVVNVAESAVKLYLESVLIGWSVAHEIERVVARLEKDGVARGSTVALVGYGAVGRATALALRALGYQVRVIEKDETRAGEATTDLFTIAAGEEAKHALLRQCDYVVGATGETSLTADELRLLKSGAVLFSASSSTVEFAVGAAPGIVLRDAPEPRATFAGQEIELGKPVSSDHWHRVIEVDGREILLANSGFPINLTGERDPIAPELIQLTRGLLLLGTMQAVRLPDDARGLIDLDPSGQLWLARAWMRRVRRSGSLPPPLMALLEAGYQRVLRELAGR